MSWERYGGLRAAIAQLAAQIMYGEAVKEYFVAKRLAAKRILGRGGARGLRYKPTDLPSNGEIKDALLALVSEIEGDSRTRRLFAMRVVALEALDALEPFRPRLMGSVATGHVREGSDIDLHVFAAHPADVESCVRDLGWTFQTKHVNILKFGKIREYVHIHVPDVFPLELTVYDPRELRLRPRSSTDGKPIVRIKASSLRALLEREHPDAWRRYVTDGILPSAEELLSDSADDADVEAEAGHAVATAMEEEDVAKDDADDARDDADDEDLPLARFEDGGPAKRRALERARARKADARPHRTNERTP